MKKTFIIVAVVVVLLGGGTVYGLLQQGKTGEALPETETATSTVSNEPVQKSAPKTSIETRINSVAWTGFQGQVYRAKGSEVYCYNYKITEADPSTFTLIGITTLAKDKNFVYHCRSGSEDGGPWYYIVPGADPQSFNLLGDGTFYAEDSAHIYFYSRGGGYYPVNTVDRSTFSVFESDPGYAKDKDHVYVFGAVIKEADPKTFVPTTPSEELYYEKYR